MRLLLLANPEASAYEPVKLDAVKRQLAVAHDVTMARTEERDHATALAREAVATGIEAVVVLGADGTINEAANGLVGSGTALAVLPGGMTNVFARTIGTPRGLTRAVERVLGALAVGSVRPVAARRKPTSSARAALRTSAFGPCSSQDSQ